jgi:7-carboxy-7-deazaguanine synthase
LSERDSLSPAALPLMEDFYSIQGEGLYQGQAAYFIRLGGCDVGCVWCDVKASWNAEDHPEVPVDEMVSRAVSSGTRIVVITGGEPAMYDLAILTTGLRKAGLQTHLETSGAYPLTGIWDWVCLSPKKYKAPHPTTYAFANELKIVVYHKSDLAWAEEHALRVNALCKLFLQPEWSREKEMLPLIVNYVKLHPDWNISLQIHKYMDVP